MDKIKDAKIENIHKNMVSLRRKLKLSQTEFLEKYMLCDGSGMKKMSLSKYSHFERFGGRDAEEIAVCVAAKAGMDREALVMDPDRFIVFIDELYRDAEPTVSSSKAYITGQNSQVEQLVRIISDYISQGILSKKLKLGGKLPSDRDLAAQFNVGRTAIREAMKVLSVLGLIDIRPGQGTFICKNSSNFFLLPLSWGMFIGEGSIDNIIEVRNVLETKSAQLAALNATETEIEFLTKVFEESKEAYNSGNFSSFLDYDMEFHLAVAKCSHNPIIQNLLFTSRSMIKQISRSGMITMENLGNIYAEHGIIYKAIVEKDAKKASETMLAHLINSCARYQINK